MDQILSKPAGLKRLSGPVRASPDLIDAFIVILIATAVDIFVFSMATQFIYSAIWTSVVSGGAGIGMAILKAPGRKPGQHAPTPLMPSLWPARTVDPLAMKAEASASRNENVRGHGTVGQFGPAPHVAFGSAFISYQAAEGTRAGEDRPARWRSCRPPGGRHPAPDRCGCAPARVARAAPR
jgi:hypothetical protein